MVQVVYLQRHCGLSVDQADDLMNKQSGLLGLAGKADLRAVTEEAQAGSERAAAALEVRPSSAGCATHA